MPSFPLRIIEREMNTMHDDDRIPEVHDAITEAQKVVQEQEAKAKRMEVKRGRKEYIEVLTLIYELALPLHSCITNFTYSSCLVMVNSQGRDVQ